MDYAQSKEKIRQKIKEFRLIDDAFMRKVFSDNIEGATLLVQIILDRPGLKVTDVRTQEDIKNLEGKSVILDMLAKDEEGRLYNIEVKRKDEDVGVKRANLHSSLLVSHACEPGREPVDYPEIYIIFITENDVLKKGRPIYHIEQMIVEDCEEIDDNEHVIYVNGKRQNDDTKLGMLMHDFFCKNPHDMYYWELAERTLYYKENKNGVDAMCRILQEARDEGKAEGLAEGKAEGLAEGKAEGLAEGLAKGQAKEKYASARRALAQDLPVEVAAIVADLPVDAVRKIADQERGKSGASL